MTKTPIQTGLRSMSNGSGEFFEIVVIVVVGIWLVGCVPLPRLVHIAQLHNDDGSHGDSDDDAIDDGVHRYSFLRHWEYAAGS